MSVTFFCTNAPEFPAAIFDNRKRDYSSDEGDVIVSMATPFELNVSNSNSHLVLKAMGIEHDYCGSIEVDRLSGILDGLRMPIYEDEGMDRYNMRLKYLLLYCIHLNQPLCWG